MPKASKQDEKSKIQKKIKTMSRAKQKPDTTYLPASTLCDRENTGHVNTTHTPTCTTPAVTARGTSHNKARNSYIITNIKQQFCRT